MRRLNAIPRTGWQKIVQSQGFTCHTHEGGGTYWDESHFYEFTTSEVALIENATSELRKMFLAALEHVIVENRFAAMNIGGAARELIVDAWEAQSPSLYGRFDLGYDGENLKLLEFNADTPTALLEAAVIQKEWKQDVCPGVGQYNVIAERLDAAWKNVLRQVYVPHIWFASLDYCEDAMTVKYLMETLCRAGGLAHLVSMRRIGLDTRTKKFVDTKNEPISTLFKLYPWDNLVKDRFGEFIGGSGTLFIEPAWRMVLSNKAILAILWEMYPEHPLLLPTEFACNLVGGFRVVRKPFVGREGANLAIMQRGTNGATVAYAPTLETPGPYCGPYVYQKFMDIPAFCGNYPVIGSWLIGDKPAGIGMREDCSVVTGALNRFVPHIVVDAR